MHGFLVVIEKANGNYSAYCPDLPGCIATGDTPEEAEAKMREAVQLHLEGLIEDGELIPPAEEVFERIARRSPVDLGGSVAEMLREEREGRGRSTGAAARDPSRSAREESRGPARPSGRSSRRRG